MSHLARLLMSIPQVTSGGPVVPAVGEAFGGGYYVGKMQYPDGIYALVIAPKATGEDSSFTRFYANAGVSFSGNTSVYDGLVIRDNMIAAGIANFPAQQWCNGLTIGGFTDWYLPAREELEICYRYLKPTTGANITTVGATAHSVPPTSNYVAGNPAQTTAALFRATTQRFASDYYWCASYSGDAEYPGHVIRMTTGARAVTPYDDTYYIRAVRRVFLEAA